MLFVCPFPHPRYYFANHYMYSIVPRRRIQSGGAARVLHIMAHNGEATDALGMTVLMLHARWAGRHDVPCLPCIVAL